MPFSPTMPSAEDWIRDPVGSWGRLQQALQYAIDVYTTTKAQIPVLKARISTWRAQLAKFPPDAERSALLDEIARHEREVSLLESQGQSLQSRTLDAISQARALAAQIGQTLKTVGLGLPLPLIIATIGVIGVVLAGALQFGAAYQLRKRESESIPAKILEYANKRNLTPAQIGQLSTDLSKNKPSDPKGFGPFEGLAGLIPIGVGVLAVFFLGPPLLKRLGGSIGGGR